MNVLLWPVSFHASANICDKLQRKVERCSKSVRLTECDITYLSLNIPFVHVSLVKTLYSSTDDVRNKQKKNLPLGVHIVSEDTN